MSLTYTLFIYHGGVSYKNLHYWRLKGYLHTENITTSNFYKTTANLGCSYL